MSKHRFWVIWCPSHGAPTFRHNCRNEAIVEARRLAAQCPGSTFIILEAIAEYVKTDIQVTELEPNHEYDEIPF